MTQQEIDAAYQSGFERAVKEAGILSNLYKSVKGMGLMNTGRAMLGYNVPGGTPKPRTIAQLPNPVSQFGQRNQLAGQMDTSFPGETTPAVTPPTKPVAPVSSPTAVAAYGR